MDRMLKIKISRSVLYLIPLLSMQAGNIFCVAPQGCSNNNGSAYCDFERWAPPLMDKDFGPEPPYELRLGKIKGLIPAGAFGGLNGPLTNINTFMKLFCRPGSRTRLFRSIFTSNLHWVSDLWIYDCYLENGLSQRLLENLRSLKYLTIAGGGSVIGIEGLVAHDALAGLTNLQEITVYAPIKSGSIPAGFFDGLNNLTLINLRHTNLNFIPPNWFEGLVFLEKIFVSHNNLQTLPRGLFDELSSLTDVALHNNPWNCSCELTWLLNLSYITGGAVCQSPSDVQGIKFRDALGVLDCAASSPTILSTSVPSATEITDTQTSPSASVLISLQPMETFVTPVTETAIPPMGTTSLTHTSKEVPTTKATSITVTISADFSKGATAEEIITTDAIGVSSFPSATVTFVSLSNSITRRTSASNHRENRKDRFVNNLRNMVLGSTVGTLSVLMVVVAVLFRYGCRNQCFGSGVNSVSNGEEDRDGQDPRNTDISNSSTANPQTG